MKLCILSWLTVAMVVAGIAQAVPVVDGTLDAEYGDALFIQNTRTQFGDSTDPSQMTSAGGSEMDGFYATVANGRLYVMMTGNLENNFNKWEVFIDSQDGGFNSMPYDSHTNIGTTFLNELPEVDPYFTGGNDGTGAFQRMADDFAQIGMTFDVGFEADYFLSFTNGEEEEKTSGNFPRSWAFTAHFSPIDTLASFGGSLAEHPTAQWGALGGNTAAAVVGGTMIDGNDPVVNDFDNFWVERETDNSVVGIEATIDNSNIAGVPGYTSDPIATQEEMDAAAAVTTGIEFSIALSQIGNPTGDIRIAAMINGGEHHFLSNQVTGGVLQGNLGGDNFGTFIGNLGDIDFQFIDGDQFVTVSQPEFNAADFNEDGAVDGDDFLIWQGGFQQFDGDASKMDGDANTDGFVDGNDFLVWQSNFGSAEGSSSRAVPEPSSLLIVLIGGALVGLTRRGSKRVC